MPNKTQATENSKNRVADRPAGAQAIQPTADLVEYMQDYARERPEVVALWCFGVGFVLGWKLKFW